MFSILCVFILSSTTTKNVQAEHSDSVVIDNVQEPEYENIWDMDGYRVYYAYNNSHHFLFIITPIDFEVLTLTVVRLEVRVFLFICVLHKINHQVKL